MSDFSCIGLDVADEREFDALLGEALPRAVLLGRAGGVELRRWEDPDSGARLLIEIRGRTVHGIVPSLASRPGAVLGRVEQVNGDVSAADILDEDGEQVTSAAFEVEERRLLRRGAHPGGPASLVALGPAVTVHDDEEAFAASPASLLDPDDQDDGRPVPDRVAAEGIAWPLRLAARSFISLGVFAPPAETDAYARMSGVVLAGQRRINSLTGDAFHVARVATVGFEIDVCLPAAVHPHTPAPGPGRLGPRLPRRLPAPPRGRRPAPLVAPRLTTPCAEIAHGLTGRPLGAG